MTSEYKSSSKILFCYEGCFWDNWENWNKVYGLDTSGINNSTVSMLITYFDNCVVIIRENFFVFRKYKMKLFQSTLFSLIFKWFLKNYV